MQIIATVVVLTLVIGLYIGSYLLNKNTPVPEGIIPVEGCDSCSSTSCGHHPSHSKSKDESAHSHNYDCDL